MALHALVTCKKKLWRKVNGIKCHNPHSFQEGVIFLSEYPWNKTNITFILLSSLYPSLPNMVAPPVNCAQTTFNQIFLRISQGFSKQLLNVGTVFRSHFKDWQKSLLGHFPILIHRNCDVFSKTGAWISLQLHSK